MVKGFDSSATDVSKAFLEYILLIFQKDPPLSLSQAELTFKQYLADDKSATHQIYRKFNQMQTKPSIQFRKRCPKPRMNIFKDFLPYNGDKHYPAYPQQDGNKIVVCLQHIKNKIELKQNIDRQLQINCSLAENRQKIKDKKNKQQKIHKIEDQILIKSLYQGCYAGYKNYLLPDHQTQKISKKCAKYLFRRRTTSDLPHDSLFRYADRIGEQI